MFVLLSWMTNCSISGCAPFSEHSFATAVQEQDPLSGFSNCPFHCFCNWAQTSPVQKDYSLVCMLCWNPFLSAAGQVLVCSAFILKGLFQTKEVSGWILSEQEPVEETNKVLLFCFELLILLQTWIFFGAQRWVRVIGLPSVHYQNSASPELQFGSISFS